MASAYNEPFSVAVIGLGPIGSAASRHLSLVLGPSLLAIGAPEPDSNSNTGPFSSHFDQSRITRIVDPDPVWSLLAARSIARYASLQQESGISFHQPVGSIRVSPALDQPDDGVRSSFVVAKTNGAVVELIENASALQEAFPYFGFRPDEGASVERGGAGFIKPLDMISAQLAVTEKNGACILRETVTQILPADEGVRIISETGKTFLAQKALVCAGSYSGFLLPKRNLDLRIEAVSVLLAEMTSEEQQRLQGMPSFIWGLKSHTFFHAAYGCPPTPYPGGKVYVKIAGFAWEPVYLSSSEQMSEWFHGHGNPEELKALLEALEQLLPNLKISSLSSKPCVFSHTAHGYPYIDAADGEPIGHSRIFVAAGGCGSSAKSSDEIGRIAALLVKEGKWASDWDASIFRAVFTEDIVHSKSLLHRD